MTLRNPDHDYAQSAMYFITFNTYKRRRLLGRVVGDTVELSDCGRIVDQVWKELPKYYERVVRDAFIVMPDHVHCIMLLTSIPKSGILQPPKPVPLPEILRGFKSLSSRRINKLLGRQGVPVWQDGYRERVIMDERELDRFRYYILTNPQRWTMKHGE
jgi:REP element-mobilizing transposase RayT